MAAVIVTSSGVMSAVVVAVVLEGVVACGRPPEGDARGGHGDASADGALGDVAPVALQVTLVSTGLVVQVEIVAVLVPS